jgi:hypothetical protein
MDSAPQPFPGILEFMEANFTVIQLAFNLTSDFFAIYPPLGWDEATSMPPMLIKPMQPKTGFLLL